MTIRSSAAALCLVAMCAACVPTKEYHRADPVTRLCLTRDADRQCTDPENDAVSLAYVEFDDNGELFDRNELDQAVHRVQEVEGRTPSGIDVVVFIHGWKNDADNSGNVNGFQRFLREISRRRNPGSVPVTARRPIVGIYMAWRGAALKLGQNLTYWNRSLATTRVAGPHFEEALSRIVRASKEPKTAANNTLIVIGHSFGGRVLEHAMTPYFETLLLRTSGAEFGPCVQRSNAPGTPVSGAWPDLTVLLNEAAPATDAKAFLETLTCHDVRYTRSDGGGNTVDAPLILSFTSDGDAATGVALWGGQWLATSQLRLRKYDPPDPNAPWEGPAEVTDQKTYFTHSAAHIPALHSHELLSLRSSAGLDVCAAPVVFDRSKGPIIHVGRDLNRQHGQRPASDQYQYELCPAATTHDPAHPSPYWNHTPYWIFKIPIEIVPDHSDIFRNEVFDLLEFFLPPPGAGATLTVR